MSVYLFVEGTDMERSVSRGVLDTHVCSVIQEVLQVLDMAISTSLDHTHIYTHRENSKKLQMKWECFLEQDNNPNHEAKSMEK